MPYRWPLGAQRGALLWSLPDRFSWFGMRVAETDLTGGGSEHVSEGQPPQPVGGLSDSGPGGSGCCHIPRGRPKVAADGRSFPS